MLPTPNKKLDKIPVIACLVALGAPLAPIITFKPYVTKLIGRKADMTSRFKTSLYKMD